MEKELFKGTTTIGLQCTDGVVVATERRASMGTLVAHKNTQKLYKIDDHLAMTVAGLVGDAQLLARWLKAEAELFKLKHDRKLSTKAAATLMANIMARKGYYPFWVQLVICGVDNEGSHVYSLDAAGGCIPDKYVTTGSGSPYVYGVLEDQYKTSMGTKDGVDLAIRAISAAMKRDAVSGDGIDVAVIKNNEFKQLTEKDITDRKSKMKIN